MRLENMLLWKNRFSQILREIETIRADDSSSHHQWDRDYWLKENEIEIGKIAAWIFVNEDKG